MHRFVLPLLLSVSALAGASFVSAADLEPPPPPIDDLRGSTYDWTGLYVGAWVGSACIDGELTDNSGTTPGTFEMAGCGGKGGITAGYNHQFENFVLGLEGDWGMSGRMAKNEEAGVDFSFAMKSIATLRARAGIAFDDTLLYVTGGGAWAIGDVDGIISSVPDHINRDHWGWTLGGGIEHAVTDNFRLRLDYLYTLLSTENYTEQCTPTIRCDLDVNPGGEHEIRLGAIWSFATW